MPIVTCECGKTMRAPDGSQGRKVDCPGCGAGLVIPDEAEPKHRSFFQTLSPESRKAMSHIFHEVLTNPQPPKRFRSEPKRPPTAEERANAERRKQLVAEERGRAEHRRQRAGKALAKHAHATGDVTGEVDDFLLQTGTVTFDLDMFAKSLAVPIYLLRRLDGRSLGFLAEVLAVRVLRCLSYGPKGASFDNYDPNLGRWEVRSLRGKVSFAPSSRGKSKEKRLKAFREKLQALQRSSGGYLVFDLDLGKHWSSAESPKRLTWWSVPAFYVEEWHQESPTKPVEMTRRQFLGRVDHELLRCTANCPHCPTGPLAGLFDDLL